MAGPSVLIVDDEPAVRKAIECVIRMTMKCEIHTAESGKEGLALMEKQPFTVVVSDIQMPGMDGVDFLHIVQEVHPRTIRLAFTGCLSTKVACQTAGSVHQFFQKPTDLKILSSKIQQVVRLRYLLPDEGVERVVACVKTLPSLPQVYMDLEHELHSEQPSLDRVGKIFEQDLAMSAKILQLVNSAFFGLREHVSSASQAVSLLGLNTIRSLVLAFHIFSRWDRKERFLFDPDELWRHSLNVSCLARDIAELEHADNQFRENAAIGGMFHDLGKLVLATHLPDSSCAIGKLTHGHLKTPLEAETQVLGATHAEIGAYLLALWGFGDPIVKAAAFHHKLDRTDSQGLSVEVVVHVANVFDYEEEGVLLPPDTRINAELLERLGLRSRCEQWRAALLKRHAETAQPATPQAAKDPTKGDLGIEEA